MVHLSVVKVLLKVFIAPAKTVVASGTIIIFFIEETWIVEIQIHASGFCQFAKYSIGDRSQYKCHKRSNWMFALHSNVSNIKEGVLRDYNQLIFFPCYKNQELFLFFFCYLICLGKWLAQDIPVTSGLDLDNVGTVIVSLCQRRRHESHRPLENGRGQEHRPRSTDDPQPQRSSKYGSILCGWDK